MIRKMLLIAGFLAGIPSFLMAQSYLPDALGSYARGIDDMTMLLVWISVFFLVLVTVLLVVFAIRYRAGKKTGDGARIHGNVKLEIFWTTVPFLIMLVLGILAWGPMLDQLTPPEDSLVVKVTGYAFDWDFEYFKAVPDDGTNQPATFDFICGNPKVLVRAVSLGVKTTHNLKLPLNRPVRFIITSQDVLHSWWIPEWRYKADAVPNYYSDGWLTPDRLSPPGKPFIAKCAELCGPDHAVMQAGVEVVSGDNFDKWLADERVKQSALTLAP